MDDTYKRKKRAESNLLDSFMDRQEIFFEYLFDVGLLNAVIYAA